MHTAQYFKYIYIVVQPTLELSHLAKLKLYTYWLLISPFPQSLATAILLFDCSWYLTRYQGVNPDNVLRVHPCCVSCVRISFLFKADNVPLQVCDTFSLSIHCLMNDWVAFTFWLLWPMLLCRWVYRHPLRPFFQYSGIETQQSYCWVMW
jgi:hypothetical protein